MLVFGLWLTLCISGFSWTLNAAEPTSLAGEFVGEYEHKQLKKVFPTADVFSEKSGRYPTHKAFSKDVETGDLHLLGYVFLTTDVEPHERAYGGPIPILVGMTVDGVLTGVKVRPHNEPWSTFSIDPPEFAEQFVGKSVLDPFEVGRDIDAVTRVTITVNGATRVIKKSARKIARQHLETN